MTSTPRRRAFCFASRSSSRAAWERFRSCSRTTETSRREATKREELKMRRFAIAAALCLIGASAHAQDVKVDFDKDANFATIKTFAVKIGTSWNNPISEKRITDEITNTLKEKG